MAYQALHEQVMLEEMDMENQEMKKWRILYTSPEKYKELAKGKVISKGTEVPDHVQEGDVVYFDKHVPHKAIFDGKETLTLLRQEVKIKEC